MRNFGTKLEDFFAGQKNPLLLTKVTSGTTVPTLLVRIA